LTRHGGGDKTSTKSERAAVSIVTGMGAIWIFIGASVRLPFRSAGDGDPFAWGISGELYG
jgi:hypothetical protein